MFEIFIQSLSAESTMTEIKRKPFSRTWSMRYFYRTPTSAKHLRRKTKIPNSKPHKNTCVGSERISWRELIKIMTYFVSRVLPDLATVTLPNDVHRFLANSAHTAFKHYKKKIIYNTEVTEDNIARVSNLSHKRKTYLHNFGVINRN